MGFDSVDNWHGIVYIAVMSLHSTAGSSAGPLRRENVTLSLTLVNWPLTQNLISSSLAQDAPMTKVWRKSINRYWRYRGNIMDARPHWRTYGRMEWTHVQNTICGPPVPFVGRRLNNKLLLWSKRLMCCEIGCSFCSANLPLRRAFKNLFGHCEKSAYRQHVEVCYAGVI